MLYCNQMSWHVFQFDCSSFNSLSGIFLQEDRQLSVSVRLPQQETAQQPYIWYILFYSLPLSPYHSLSLTRMIVSWSVQCIIFIRKKLLLIDLWTWVVIACFLAVVGMFVLPTISTHVTYCRPAVCHYMSLYMLCCNEDFSPADFNRSDQLTWWTIISLLSP